MNINKTTDTNQASELYELCKEVYERTGWDGTQFYYHERDTFDFETRSFKRNGTHAVVERRRADYDIPLYNSDYLLEKLPRSIINDSDDWTDDTFWLTLTAGVDNWHAYYELANHKERHWGLVADTPLKALLKLTIALSEAGELNDQSS